jgi:hypothetical protein
MDMIKEKDNAMAKEKAIVNRYDTSFPARDRYDSKYFKYLGNVQETGGDILEAFRTKDIFKIVAAIKHLADSMKSHIFIIGMGCVIIDREMLYADAGFHSYLDCARHLYEETGLSPQTLSAAKIIIERFIDYNAELRQHGFILENNSNKLLYLENALEKHGDRAEVFRRVAGDTFREFQAYARTSDDEPAPQRFPKIKIEESRILVNGKNILNFSKDIPVREKEVLGGYLSEIYAIRAAGNTPLIVETYDEREARALKKGIEGLLKKIRSRR